MGDRVSLALGIVICFAVIATVVAYVMFVPEMNAGTLTVPLIAIVLVLLAFWVLRERFKSMKSGMPAEDERTRKIWHKSGYYAWIATIWICLGLAWINEILVEDFGFSGLIPRHMAFAILALSAFTFFVLYFWFRWRGEA